MYTKDFPPKHLCVSFLTWLRFSSKRMAKCKLQAHSANFTTRFKNCLVNIWSHLEINIIYSQMFEWNGMNAALAKRWEREDTVGKDGVNATKNITRRLSGCQILQALIFKWKWSLYYFVKWRAQHSFTASTQYTASDENSWYKWMWMWYVLLRWCGALATCSLVGIVRIFSFSCCRAR